MSRLAEALRSGLVIGDGANGTVLSAKGFPHQPYDLANLLAPSLVVEVHSAYFDAGSQFVETNTFAANRFKLGGHGVDPREVNLAGARLARQAAGSGRLVLGAIGPAGKPMAPIGAIERAEVVAAAREQAEALAEGGVDGFFLETFVDLDELEAAVEGVRSVCDLPIVVSKAFIEDGEMLAEGLPVRVAERLSRLEPAAVGANCIVGPQRMTDIVRMLGEGTSLPVVALPTPGLPQLVKGQIAYDTSPEYFARATARLVEEGARVVGGCCGTTPEHIRQIASVCGGGKVKPRPRRVHAATVAEREPLPEAEPTELKLKLGKKFISAVEVDLPRGANLQKLMTAVRTLKIAGVDVIDISDGARARLRVNPMAVCSTIQRQVGIETTMHFSCRDRNLLAIQADLLGCFALGVRNILAVTGDPANIGDYPSATSVFDVDAIGLTRILSRLNDGIDLAGYSVGVRTNFTICVAYNPVAFDQPFEDERLARKAEAGAHVVYTQPVFEDSAVDRAVEAAARHGLPVFVGVLPLRSAKHCEFMHNEVPGMSVPDWLRRKMAEASDDATARMVGLEESQRLARRVREIAQGIYLMPPAQNPAVAVQVLEALV
ncbi:MAG: bifunctional homocysteine S-methyltransferase/methylenetetrahydrofolate reductase [Fimbriimonadaceae bacterium]